MASLSERLRFLRTQRNMTQEELAEYIGIGKQAISQYERGVRRPDYETIILFCDFFNVSSDYMIGKSNVTLKLLNSDDIQKLDKKKNKIPVLGKVAAGLPIEAQEEVIDWEEITDAMSKDGDYFALQIQGDSMEPRITNGDVIIVRKQDDAESGDTVVAMINGNDAVCKKLKKYKDGIALISTNPAYEPLYFSYSEIGDIPVKIIGKVKELRAKF